MKTKDKPNIELLLYALGILIFLLALILPIDPAIKTLGYILATLVSGYHVMWESIEDTIQKSVSAKKFLPNTHLLMTLAALGAILLNQASEAALLIFIFAGAHFLEEYVQDKSKKEMAKLLQLNPIQARRLDDDGQISLVSVSSLKIGDRVQVLNGDQIPTDGLILEGHASIDESTITGEAIPADKTVGDEVFASTINGNTSFAMTVTKDASDTLFSKIITLVKASQENLSQTASLIERFEPIYVSGVLIVFCLIFLTGPLFFAQSWQKTFEVGLTFMVSASPCALAVSVLPATLAGMSQLARQGVLFKGGAALSTLYKLKAIAFDKTGTLTEGKPKVVDSYFKSDSFTQEELKDILVTMEKQSNHPLAKQ